MLTNRDDVLALLQGIRADALDHFIPLGGYDISTKSKKDISNLTGTLYNHLPLVKSIVEATREKPVYVGYDGNSPEDRGATYTNNLILLHDSADESDMDFITSYTHELVHLDQDRRNLLRENDTPPAPEHLVDYLAHNLMLEAAAFATEAVSLYYLAGHSRLKDSYEQLEEFFDAYDDAQPGNGMLRLTIETAMEGKRIKDYHSMKPAWQAVFQSFFDPDSPRVSHYLKQFAQVYLSKLNNEAKDGPDSAWGGVNELRAITTLPGIGPMFTQGAMPVLQRAILASILQEKHLEVIDVVRGHAWRSRPREQDILKFIQNLQP